MLHSRSVRLRPRYAKAQDPGGNEYIPAQAAKAKNKSFFVKGGHGKLKTNRKAILRGCLCGLLAGFLNGLLGAGGGMAVVPALERSGLSPNRAHATSIAVITPLCVLSAVLYLQNREISFADALPYLPAGLAGTLLGAKVLPRIPAEALRRVFGAFMLYAAWRLLSR